MAGLWEQFVELHALRGTDIGMEIVPRTITYLDIAAWASVTGRTLSVFDMSVIARLEQSFWRVYHGGGKDENQKSLVAQFAAIQDSNKKMRKVAIGK